MSSTSHDGVSIHEHHPRARPKRARGGAVKHPKRGPTHARSPRPQAHPPAHGHGRLFTVIAVSMVLVSSLVIGALALRKRVVTKHAAEALAAEVDRGPHILLARARPGPGTHDYALAAEVRGYSQTTAYAKVSGYVREIRVDKGDHVKKGDVLGIVDSPETDNVVRGAQSDLSLRKQLLDRAKILAPNVMSLQDLQSASSNFKVSSSSLASALALQSYETIRAPFDGIVTMRYVDPGALMPAATGATTSAQPLVDIADPSRLRIWAYVGQDEALFIHAGDPVTISQGDRAHVDATVTRTAGALDPRTRTMLCEIEIDNAKGSLMPGGFSQVTFHLHSPSSPWVPSEALVLRQGKELVGVVANNRVRLVAVTTGVTDGRNLQITTGLDGSEMVALNLPAEVGDGDAVQASERPKTGGDEKAPLPSASDPEPSPADEPKSGGR